MKKIKLYPIFVCFLMALALVVMIAPSAFADWQAQTPAQSTSYTTATMPAATNLSVTGGVWTQNSLPAGTPTLTSISCTSATFCMAVGGLSYYLPSTNPAAGVTWNGTSWTPATPPVSLYAVSCTSSTFCMGVTSEKYTIWNGTSWGPTGAIPVSFYGNGAVSCTSPTFCMAVGNSTAIWNGTSWSPTTTAPPAPWSGFFSASCTSPTFCMVAGWYYGGLGDNYGVAYTWDGSGYNTTTFSTQVGSLFGVSCTSPTFCVTGGQGNPDDVAVWNGTSWTSYAYVGLQFYDMSCTSPTFCDGAEYTPAPQAGIATWNGTSWVSQSFPAGATGFFGMSCLSSGRCYAAGMNSSSNGLVDNIETVVHWTPGSGTDALSHPLTASQNILGCFGPSCTPTTSVATNIPPLSSSYSMASDDTCYAVESVSRSGSWTAMSSPVCVT